MLLFQCERAFYSCCICIDDDKDDNPDDKNDNPDDKDDDYDVKKEDKYHKRFYKIGNKFSFHLILYVIIPFITFFLLVVLIMGVVILSDLAFDHSNNFKDNQLQTLIALLPTFILFFGSLYRRDLFIADHKDEIEAKSEKEFLHEILQESRKEKEFLHGILQDLENRFHRVDASDHPADESDPPANASNCPAGTSRR